MYQFSDKMENFEFLGPNLPKNGFWGRNFKKSKSGFAINTSKIPCESIFSQNGQLLILRSKFGEIAHYVQYFGSNIVEGVAESWVEAKMGWVEVEMSWVEVDGAGWSCVEVDGAGWRWVHGLEYPFLYINRQLEQVQSHLVLSED